ncbi:MAG: hypothetical protein IJ127_28725, partial [Afipia sp.]|nr:hypothetical protein [Afipia sp.]
MRIIVVVAAGLGLAGCSSFSMPDMFKSTPPSATIQPTVRPGIPAPGPANVAPATTPQPPAGAKLPQANTLPAPGAPGSPAAAAGPGAGSPNGPPRAAEPAPAGNAP